MKSNLFAKEVYKLISDGKSVEECSKFSAFLKFNLGISNRIYEN